MTRIKLMMGHRSIVAMAVVLLTAFAAMVWAAPSWVWALVPLGVFAQLLNEYNLHRFVFHMKPPRRQWAFDLLYLAHYGHHDFPTNKVLFFVPIWVAMPMLGINFAVVYGLSVVLGLAEPVWIAVAVVPLGGVAMFMVYEWYHMTAHLNLPKTRVAARVTRLHNQHHYRDFSKWFHVSPGGEIIDRTLGTNIDRAALVTQQRIAFIRTLGMAPDDPRFCSARARFAQRLGLSAAEVTQAGKVRAT